jgi:Acetyltransferase (GNAT) domain
LSDGSWEDHLATRSRNLRSQVRRKTKAVVRDFDAVLRLADSATLAADFDALAELHERRWRGGSSVFGPGPRGFHAGFAAGALRRGWLRLGVLELRGEPRRRSTAGTSATATSTTRRASTPASSARASGSSCSPGRSGGAAEESASAYDLLRASEDYKFRFADADRTVQTIAISRPVSRTRVALAADAAFWRVSRRIEWARTAKARALYQRLQR